MALTTLFFLSAMGASCGPENVLEDLNKPDDDDLAPQLVVWPDTVDFGDLRKGEAESVDIEIRNDGNVALELSSLELIADAGFTLSNTPTLPYTLEPDGAVEVTVGFTAYSVDHEGVLVLTTDDETEPRFTVTLEGGGLIPRLVVAPDPYDFGRVEPDCTIETEIELANMGKDTLVVESMAQLGEAFELIDPPETPFELEPFDPDSDDNSAAVMPVTVAFTPTDYLEYSSELWISSSAQDPRAIQTGIGSDGTAYVDEWTQPISGVADIMFWVDQSGSMQDDLDHLNANFDLFLDTLDAVESDYLIMVVVADSGCHTLDYIRSEDSREQRELTFKTAIYGGSPGLYAEAGLTIARAALRDVNTGLGGCNSEFRRENSTVSVVLVSDEPDQSYLAGPQVSWESVVTDLLAQAPSTYISAVAGPVPDGCQTAEPGTGYSEAVAATGGTFIDICSRNWGENLAKLAEQATTAKLADTFQLEDDVNETSIEVYVDDVQVETGWSYQAEGSYLVFDADAVPGEGATIRVEYETAVSCEN